LEFSNDWKDVDMTSVSKSANSPTSDRVPTELEELNFKIALCGCLILRINEWNLANDSLCEEF